MSYYAYDVMIDYERETQRLREQEDRDLEDELEHDERSAALFGDDREDWPAS